MQHRYRLQHTFLIHCAIYHDVAAHDWYGAASILHRLGKIDSQHLACAQLKGDVIAIDAVDGSPELRPKRLGRGRSLLEEGFRLRR